VWVVVLPWAAPALAYRPFVSTDAAVADPREIEIELGAFTLERQKGTNAFVVPSVVVNYGLFRNWEAVAEFSVRRSPDATVDLVDPALFLKGVLKEGVLQDKEGIGVAVELGPLLPSTEKGERRFGFEGIGILTDTLGPITVHVNGGLGIERSSGDLVVIWGMIGELPVSKAFRIVAEVNGETPRRQALRDSVLLGAIWRPWSEKNVWLDAGVRRGLTSGVPDWVATVGITFGFSTSAATTPAASASR
jgi:hypothetical protein